MDVDVSAVAGTDGEVKVAMCADAAVDHAVHGVGQMLDGGGGGTRVVHGRTGACGGRRGRGVEGE